jgi:hypothetical protein
LLIEKEIIKKRQYLTKMKHVKDEYESSLDPQIGIYRDAEYGPCEVCMIQGDEWEERVFGDAGICD